MDDPLSNLSIIKHCITNQAIPVILPLLNEHVSLLSPHISDCIHILEESEHTPRITLSLIHFTLQNYKKAIKFYIEHVNSSFSKQQNQNTDFYNFFIKAIHIKMIEMYPFKDTEHESYSSLNDNIKKYIINTTQNDPLLLTFVIKHDISFLCNLIQNFDISIHKIKEIAETENILHNFYTSILEYPLKGNGIMVKIDALMYFKRKNEVFQIVKDLLNDLETCYTVCFYINECYNLYFTHKEITDFIEEIPEHAQNLYCILTGNLKRKMNLKLMAKNNKTDFGYLQTMIKPLTRHASAHTGIVFANALMNMSTTNDTFHRINIDLLCQTRHWNKCIGYSCLGMIHIGNEKPLEILQNVLPNEKELSDGGSLISLGMIECNKKSTDNLIQNYLLNFIESSNTLNTQTLMYGACLGLGLVNLGKYDKELIEIFLNIIDDENVLAGEASIYAIGMNIIQEGIEKGNTSEEIDGKVSEEIDGKLSEKKDGKCEEIDGKVVESNTHASNNTNSKINNTNASNTNYTASNTHASNTTSNNTSSNNTNYTASNTHASNNFINNTSSNNTNYTTSNTNYTTSNTNLNSTFFSINKSFDSINDLTQNLYELACKTKHEKIARACGITISLSQIQKRRISPLVNEMLHSKNEIVRSCAPYCVGSSFAGTSDLNAVSILSSMTNDVCDDVKRSCVISLGLVCCNNKETLFSVLEPLANHHCQFVRGAVAITLGFFSSDDTCYSSFNNASFSDSISNSNSYDESNTNVQSLFDSKCGDLLEVLMYDSDALVRQSALIGVGFFLAQKNKKTLANFKRIVERLNLLIVEKQDNNCNSIGAIIGRSLMESGGRNIVFGVNNLYGKIDTVKVTGYILFMQYWYCYSHFVFLSLCSTSTFYVCVDINNLESLELVDKEVFVYGIKEDYDVNEIRVPELKNRRRRRLRRRYGKKEENDVIKDEENENNGEKEQCEEKEYGIKSGERMTYDEMRKAGIKNLAYQFVNGAGKRKGY